MTNFNNAQDLKKWNSLTSDQIRQDIEEFNNSIMKQVLDSFIVKAANLIEKEIYDKETIIQKISRDIKIFKLDIDFYGHAITREEGYQGFLDDLENELTIFIKEAYIAYNRHKINMMAA